MSGSSDRLRALLKLSDPFCALPDKTLDHLITRGRLTRFARDDVIYRRGDIGDSLMVVLSGGVKITNVCANGRETILGFIGVGAINGEIAAFDGKDRTASAIAMQ